MRTITNISEELKYRGYNPNPKILIPSKELLEIEILIRETQNKSYQLDKIKLKKALELSREFIMQNMKLLPVPFLSETKIGPLKIERSGFINPLNIPIRKVKNVDDFYGCLREVLTFRENDEVENAYRFIEISRNTTNLSSLAYTHEIVHSQLNHVKGLVKEYYNTELLSIFFETVEAYETDKTESLLKIHDSIRLLELAAIIKELKENENSQEQDILNVLIEGSSYAESTLKAYNLFTRYYYSNNKERKYLLSNINRVFKQEISLEDLLSKLDISLESSTDSKSLRKYYQR